MSLWNYQVTTRVDRRLPGTIFKRDSKVTGCRSYITADVRNVFAYTKCPDEHSRDVFAVQTQTVNCHWIQSYTCTNCRLENNESYVNKRTSQLTWQVSGFLT